LHNFTTVEQWLGANNAIGIDIWNRKYKHNNESFTDWLNRVSNGDSDVRRLIVEKKFLFGGRILSNRGLQKNGLKITYSNCYVATPPEDNIESIFECAKSLARTFSYGGGVGVDISKLAPRGAKLNNAAKQTTGAVSFMDLYSLITGLIAQEGRRGALMISLDCNHPDLEEFIGAKSDLSKATSANISIKVTDEFMKAVKGREKYALSYKREATGEFIAKTVDAYEIFRKMSEMNWDYAEPGLLFWNNIENHNMLSATNDFKYAGVNPCAEEPLPAGGSCLLGSINLSEFVIGGEFDIDNFSRAVAIGVKALNDVLDEGLPLHPLQEQRDSVRDWRQIGLGIFGLADCLIKMGIRYGSHKALEVCSFIAGTMAACAIDASARLAQADGKYPKCDINAILESDFFKGRALGDTIEIVMKHGLRNSQILTCAPTGTLSTMLGVSGGIEPIFANYYTRRTQSLHGKDVEYKVYTPIVEEYMATNAIKDDSELPKFFITSQELDYKARVDMQAIWQDYIDASISSTVNLPNSATIEDVENLYMYAWERGLKGITVYRDGCKRAGILNAGVPETEALRKFDYIEPVSKDELGTTYGVNVKSRIACGNLYINACKDKDGNLVEMFVNTGKGGICQSNINAVSRLISTALRGGIIVQEIADQLKGIICPACTVASAKGEKLSGRSCADAISEVLLREYNDREMPPDVQKPHDACKECGGALKFDGGCVTCLSCGWSKCS
jgi:ribonucleoside-diphosphate reductase alpha chain